MCPTSKIREMVRRKKKEDWLEGSLIKQQLLVLVKPS